MCSLFLTKAILLSVGVGFLAYISVDLSSCLFPKTSPVVDISSGKIQGIITKSRDGREYFSFLGIPYAKPPVEDLRFQAPVEPDKWEGVRVTDRHGSACFQYAALVTGRIFGDEDCLYINVFTPEVNLSSKRLPVLVWFHGGGFLEGTAKAYGEQFLMDENIVLVTMNYRLGALGFLNTGDELVRGNMGLKDQNLALQWVQKNIVAFGGDPKQVTIFGESAGGASVHYHILSSLSKGLFSKAISQSGVVLCPWAFTRNPQHQAIRFGKLVNCPTENTKALVDCLKTKTPLELVLPNGIRMAINDEARQETGFW